MEVDDIDLANLEFWRRQLSEQAVAFAALLDAGAELAEMMGKIGEDRVRWASQVMHFRRTLTTDRARLDERRFSGGNKVVLWHWSANRDESMLCNHVGNPRPHFCRGAHLARPEITFAFKELLRNRPDIHTRAEPDRLLPSFISGIKHRPAEWTPAGP
jgi:cytochrome P450